MEQYGKHRIYTPKREEGGVCGAVPAVSQRTFGGDQVDFKAGGEVSIVIGSIQEFGQMNNPLDYKDRKEIVELGLKGAGIKNFKIFGLPDFRNNAAWSKKLLEITGLEASGAVFGFFE